MATNPSHPMDNKDYSTLWIIVAIIVAAVLAYAAYDAYYGDQTTTSLDTANNTVTGTTVNP